MTGDEIMNYTHRYGTDDGKADSQFNKSGFSVESTSSLRFFRDFPQLEEEYRENSRHTCHYVNSALIINHSKKSFINLQTAIEGFIA